MQKYNKNKVKVLPILMVIFCLAAVGRGVFWYLIEKDNKSFGQKTDRIQQAHIKASVQKNNSVPIPGIKEGEFVLKVNHYLNEETKVRYLVPVDKISGKPKTSASNIVFYAPYNGDANSIRQGLKPWLRYFAEELRFTIFSLTIEANTKIVDDHEKYYIYKEAGWYEDIFNIKNRLEKEYNLESKPLLIIGESSGSSMAQQMSALYPDRIAVAAWNGGATYVPIDASSSVVWLAMNTWGCYGIPATRKFAKQAKFQNKQVLRGETPPNFKQVKSKHFHHAASDTTYKLIQTFIRDIVELRDSNNGIVPPPEQWPVKLEICGEKKYFPSEEFARLWCQLPHEVNKQLENQNLTSDTVAVFPHLEKADKIVIYTGTPTQDESILPQDSLTVLAQEGAIPLAVKLTDNYLEDFDRIKQAIKNILAEKRWHNYPVYVIGCGISGQILASAALANNNMRITRIITFASGYEYPFEQLSIANHRKYSNIPLKMYSVDLMTIPSSDKNTEIIQVNSTDLSGKGWFTLLSTSIK